MSIYSGNTFDVVGKKLKGVQVTLTAPPSTIKVSSITDDEGNWKIEVNDINNNNVKITFTQEGRVIAIVDKPLPTGVIDRITPQTGGVLDLKGKYPGGKYYITSLESTVKEDIDKQLEDAYKFVKANPGNYRLYIESSESRVTNYDREPSSPTNGQELPPTNNDPSPLARRRAEALQKYANDFFLSKYNVENPPPEGFILPEVQIKSIATGLTTYNSQDDAVPYGGDPYAGPKGESYKSEQFTRLIAEFIVAPTVTTFPPEDKEKCIQNLEIILSTPGHKCDSAVFQIFLNDILLLRDDGKDYASLNNFTQPEDIGNRYHGLSLEQSRALQAYDNAVSGYQTTKGAPGGKRENRFIVTNEIAKQAILNNPDELVISLMCYNPTNYYEDGKGFLNIPGNVETGVWGYDCHKNGVGQLSLTNINGKKQRLNGVDTPDVRDKITKVISLNPCTLEVIHRSDYFARQAATEERNRKKALTPEELAKENKLKQYQNQLNAGRISQREYDRLVLELNQ